MWAERLFIDQRRSFAWALGWVVVLRLALAALLPITGDEAYYYYWGQWPDWGYYDHPPMVGWLLAPLTGFGASRFWIRLPAVLLIIPVAYCVIALARPAGDRPAYLAGLLVLAAPFEWLNVFITTDTPLVLFSLASVVAYAQAIQAPGVVNRWYVLAGVLLGAAMASKYFAGLTALGMAAFAALSPRSERRWPGVFVVALCALPLPLISLWWNVGNCWTNVMFNLYNRHEGDAASWRKPLAYLVTLAYLAGPFFLVNIFHAAYVAAHVRFAPARSTAGSQHAHFRLLICVAGVPLAILAAFSIFKSIGLHWPFAFAPIVFAIGAFVLREAQVLANLKWLLLLSAGHLLLVGALLGLPVETWSGMRFYGGMVLTTQTDALLAALRPYEADYEFATDGYSDSVILSFNSRRYFKVIGEGSSHGRHDDIISDMRSLAGKNVLILSKTAPRQDEYEDYFDSFEQRSFLLYGAQFHLVLGRGFRYEAYRDQILDRIREKYYLLPDYLPQRACYFCERYFETSTCPTR